MTIQEINRYNQDKREHINSLVDEYRSIIKNRRSLQTISAKDGKRAKEILDTLRSYKDAEK